MGKNDKTVTKNKIQAQNLASGQADQLKWSKFQSAWLLVNIVYPLQHVFLVFLRNLYICYHLQAYPDSMDSIKQTDLGLRGVLLVFPQS